MITKTLSHTGKNKAPVWAIGFDNQKHGKTKPAAEISSPPSESGT